MTLLNLSSTKYNFLCLDLILYNIEQRYIEKRREIIVKDTERRKSTRENWGKKTFSII